MNCRYKQDLAAGCLFDLCSRVQHADAWAVGLYRKRMQRAVDPALQRAKATRRPPYVPRATALRPLLLQVSSHQGVSLPQSV